MKKYTVQYSTDNGNIDHFKWSEKMKEVEAMNPKEAIKKATKRIECNWLLLDCWEVNHV